MKYQFFTVPVVGGAAAEAELNAFLAQNRVLAVERKFVDDGASSLWVFCVSTEAAAAAKPALAASRKPSIDYREVLSADDFEVYIRLREARKAIAEKEGVPVYAVFTNQQLAAIVQKRVASKTALKKIEGVGASRVEKYGAAILEAMTPLIEKDAEAENAA